MTSEQLSKLLGYPVGDSQTLDQVAIADGRFLATVSAFLNTQGGAIIVHIDDPSESAHLITQIRSELQYKLTPSGSMDVTIVDLHRDKTILVLVPEGLSKPYLANNLIYTVDGNDIDQASALRIRDLIRTVNTTDLVSSIVTQTAHLVGIQKSDEKQILREAIRGVLREVHNAPELELNRSQLKDMAFGAINAALLHRYLQLQLASALLARKEEVISTISDLQLSQLQELLVERLTAKGIDRGVVIEWIVNGLASAARVMTKDSKGRNEPISVEQARYRIETAIREVRSELSTVM